MKKDREICSEWVPLVEKPLRTQRETLFTENEYPHKDIYSLVGSSDPTVLFAADAKASGGRSRRNLNDLRVVLNKPSGGKTFSARLEN
ncbi:MAG: hypothetical protein V1715_13330 [bacterium]